VLERTRLAYRYTSVGEPWVHVLTGQDSDGNPRWDPISSPFGIPARLRRVNQADTYGLRAVVCDMVGNSRPVDFDRAQLARMSGAEIRCEFLANGLRVEKDGDAIAVAVLKAAKPEREIIIVDRTGWHEIDGVPDPIFITPGGEVIGAAEGLDLELASNLRVAPMVASRGTIEAWRRATDAAVAAENCPHWTLSVAAGFVGPVIDLVGLDTCGIDASGFTSQGKTLGQRLAVSAWTAPDSRKRGSLLQSMLATENSMEALAQRSSGTVLALDESAHASGQALGRVIYGIAGGTGKSRLDANAEMRDRRSWTTFAFLSSEHGLQDKVKSDGGVWTPGMAVRIADINVDGVNNNVDPDTLKAIGQIEQNFGLAGPAFVRALVKHDMHREGARLRQSVMQAAGQIGSDRNDGDAPPDDHGGKAPDSATIRAAIPFALLLIAGELAKKFGLIAPTADIKVSVIWGWRRFQRSPDASALNPDAKAIDAIRVWVAARWNVTLKCVNARTTNNREAVAWYDDSAIYIPKDTLREAAGNSLQESQVASILERHGLLVKHTEKDRLYVRYIPNVGRIKAYALSRVKFSYDLPNNK
jgi:Domain of unknown function (DUF927)